MTDLKQFKKKGPLNQIKCYECNEMIQRTTSNVYIDLTVHNKKAHGIVLGFHSRIQKQLNELKALMEELSSPSKEKELAKINQFDTL